MQNFTLILNLLKKLLKNAQKKSFKQIEEYEQKRRKGHFSVTFLLITFFWCIFSKLFQRIQNQLEILRF